jgi:TP901 family phage tail tape measure protein
MATLRELNVILTLKSESFGKELRSVEKDLKRFGSNLKAAGQNATKYVTLPLLAAGAAATTMSVNFDASLDKIVSLVGVSRKQVNEWRDDILRLAPALGTAPKELADAMFFVTSAGIKGTKALDALIASAKAARAGLGDTVTVADAVTSAINAYGEANLSAGDATGILVAAVREGKAAADEIAPALGPVVGLASDVGIGFDQVAASIAALTRTGLSASEAGTAIRSILTQLIKPGEDAKKVFKEVGLSAEGVQRSLREDGLLATLELLKGSVQGNTTAMTRMFPNVRALGGVLSLTGKNADDVRTIFKNLSETGVKALDDAFGEASKGNLFKFQQVLATVKKSLIALGDEILPIIIPVLDEIRKVIDKTAERFRKLPSSVKKTILVIAGLAAAAGPVLLALGALASVLATVAGAIAAVSIAGGLGAVFASAAPAIYIVVGAVAALTAAVTAAVVIFKAGWNQIRITIAEVWAQAAPVLSEMAQVIGLTWQAVKIQIASIMQSIAGVITTGLVLFRDLWVTYGDLILRVVKERFMQVAQAVIVATALIGTAIKKALDSLATALSVLDVILRATGVISNTKEIRKAASAINETTESVNGVTKALNASERAAAQVAEAMKGIKGEMVEASTETQFATAGAQQLNHTINQTQKSAADAAKELRQMYGVITKAEAEQALTKLLTDFQKLSAQGVNASQLLGAFGPKLKNLQDAAKGYTDLNLPKRFSEFAYVLKSESIGLVDSFARTIGDAVPDATGRAQAAIAKVGDTVATAIDTASSKASQSLERLIEIANSLDGKVITLRVTADDEDLRRKLGELGLTPDTSGILP